LFRIHLVVAIPTGELERSILLNYDG
jgi:hypothetical protein